MSPLEKRNKCSSGTLGIVQCFGLTFEVIASSTVKMDGLLFDDISFVIDVFDDRLDLCFGPRGVVDQRPGP